MHAEADRLAERRGALALLDRGAISARSRLLEGAAEDELQLLGAEPERRSVGLDRERPEAEAADDRVGEERIRPASGRTVIASTSWPGRSGSEKQRCR